MELIGGCECGVVRYRLEGPAVRTLHCHCEMCRKGHGALFASHSQFAKDRFTLESGTDELRAYESSPGIRRSFCSCCGSQLFFERTATRTRTAIEDLFESWHRSGVAMNGTPAALAELFLGLFVSDVHAEAISHGIGLARSPERLRARTDFFIQGAGLGG